MLSGNTTDLRFTPIGYAINVSSFPQEEDDLPYEEEIIRNPYSVKCWMRYIEHKQSGPKSVLNMIYERALKELPGR